VALAGALDGALEGKLRGVEKHWDGISLEKVGGPSVDLRAPSLGQPIGRSAVSGET
jgi:hypothetical protein